MAVSSVCGEFCRMFLMFLIHFLAPPLWDGIQMAVGKDDLKVSGKLSVGCSPPMWLSISLTVVVGISYSTIWVPWMSEVWSASQWFGRVWWSA